MHSAVDGESAGPRSRCSAYNVSDCALFVMDGNTKDRVRFRRSRWSETTNRRPNISALSLNMPIKRIGRWGIGGSVSVNDSESVAERALLREPAGESDREKLLDVLLSTEREPASEADGDFEVDPDAENDGLSVAD